MSVSMATEQTKNRDQYGNKPAGTGRLSRVLLAGSDGKMSKCMQQVCRERDTQDVELKNILPLRENAKPKECYSKI